MANEEEDRAYMSSCGSEGVEYRLYDIVKVFDEGFEVPHIGKILKMWEERSSGTRRALVCWFLWHKEVKPHESDNPKELFLAFGKDKGATNELNMDSIVGKCKVVCLSSDPRNKEPSVSDIENADFVFSHAYDVDLKQTCPVEVVADKMGPDVIFNTEEWLSAITKIEGKVNEFKTKQSIKRSLSESKKRPRDAEVISNQKKKVDKQYDPKKGRLSSEEATMKKKVKVSDGQAPAQKDKAREVFDSKQEAMVQSKRQPLKNEAVSRLSKTQIADVKEPTSSEGANLDKASIPRNDMVDIMELTESTIKSVERQADDGTVLCEKSKGVDTQKLNSSKVEKAQADGREEAEHEAGISDEDSKKTFLDSDFSWKEDLNKESMLKLLKKKSSLILEQISAGDPGKPFERRKFFKQLPWEESVQRGIVQGKVLHLQNIDPLLTSADMREMLSSTFEGLSDVRMLPKETSCPAGQAVAIFESRLLAESALEAIETDCLVMADKKWPIIASRVKESVNQAKFPGHLALEKLKLGRNLGSEAFKKAVSTSHCSQPNTIEFEMAMEWRQLQEITWNCRMELFKKQRRELNDVRNRGNSKAQRSKQGIV